MNKDQFKGSWRQFKGDVKEKWRHLLTTIFWKPRVITTSSSA